MMWRRTRGVSKNRHVLTLIQGRRQGRASWAAAQGPLKCGAPKLNVAMCAAMLVLSERIKILCMLLGPPRESPSPPVAGASVPRQS